LESQDLIRALDADERRRPYAITAAGSAALREHLDVLARIASTGHRRLAQAGIARLGTEPA
jgi:DNA-binding PadR family transcriptional regulator